MHLRFNSYFIIFVVIFKFFCQLLMSFPFPPFATILKSLFAPISALVRKLLVFRFHFLFFMKDTIKWLIYSWNLSGGTLWNSKLKSTFIFYSEHHGNRYTALHQYDMGVEKWLESFYPLWFLWQLKIFLYCAFEYTAKDTRITYDAIVQENHITWTRW
jgi:hypothetical protein